MQLQNQLHKKEYKNLIIFCIQSFPNKKNPFLNGGKDNKDIVL